MHAITKVQRHTCIEFKMNSITGFVFLIDVSIYFFKFFIMLTATKRTVNLDIIRKVLKMTFSDHIYWIYFREFEPLKLI